MSESYFNDIFPYFSQAADSPEEAYHCHKWLLDIFDSKTKCCLQESAPPQKLIYAAVMFSEKNQIPNKKYLAC